MGEKIEVFIIAVGKRDNMEVYHKAANRDFSFPKAFGLKKELEISDET